MKHQGNIKKGIFYVIISALGFSLMNFFVVKAGDLPTFQKALFRNGGAMIVSLFLFIKSGDTPDTKPSDLGILLMGCFRLHRTLLQLLCIGPFGALRRIDSK